MQPITKETAFKFIEMAPFVDIVLMEDESPYGTALATYAIVRYSRETGIPVYIDDILDSLSLVKKHLRFLGINEDFSDVTVIKTGGIENIGNIVERLPLESEPIMYITRHRKITSDILSEDRHLNIVLGLERLFAFLGNRREFYLFVTYLKELLGNQNRKAFYIINRKIIPIIRLNPLPELEEIASTVVKIYIRDGTHVVMPWKALLADVVGREFSGTVEEVMKW